MKLRIVTLSIIAGGFVTALQAGSACSRPVVVQPDVSHIAAKIASRRIKRWYVARLVSRDVHRMFDSAEGGDQDFEINVTSLLLRRSMCIREAGAGGGLELSRNAIGALFHHGVMKNIAIGSSPDVFRSALEKVKLQGKCCYGGIVQYRGNCAFLIHAHCRLNREEGHPENNNSAFILEKLYGYGLPRLRSSAEDKK